MKKLGNRFVFVFFLVTVTLLAGPAYTSAATGRQMSETAIQAMKATPGVTVSTTKNVPSLFWTWYEVSYNDGSYPITVDFLGSNFSTPTKIVYMLPGGGMNFKSSFLTPLDDNLAQYFRKSGYLVVGITPREDSISGTVPAVLADWGMARHVDDIDLIIDAVQARWNLPYRVLGHSFGAAYALDYASVYGLPKLEKVVALDIYSYNPALTDAENNFSEGSYWNINYLMGTGAIADASYADIKSLMLISLLLPYVISPEAYEETDGGFFTYEGFLYYSMIESHMLPSVQAGDWPLGAGNNSGHGCYAAGVYTKDACNPLKDRYSLYYSTMGTLREASIKVGSGLVPYAVYRDFFAVNGFNTPDTYMIDWGAITAKVLWVNNEFGYGFNMYGASQMTGSPSVRTYIIPGLGHLDVLSNSQVPKSYWKWFTYPDTVRYN